MLGCVPGSNEPYRLRVARGDVEPLCSVVAVGLRDREVLPFLGGVHQSPMPMSGVPGNHGRGPCQQYVVAELAAPRRCLARDLVGGLCGQEACTSKVEVGLLLWVVSVDVVQPLLRTSRRSFLVIHVESADVARPLPHDHATTSLDIASLVAGCCVGELSRRHVAKRSYEDAVVGVCTSKPYMVLESCDARLCHSELRGSRHLLRKVARVAHIQ